MSTDGRRRLLSQTANKARRLAGERANDSELVEMLEGLVLLIDVHLPLVAHTAATRLMVENDLGVDALSAANVREGDEAVRQVETQILKLAAAIDARWATTYTERLQPHANPTSTAV
ncbi:MAG TPA: hypothetical protein VHD87_08110 [Acidimicrobiales bacterium]|nr:hypothetical protein [Acidimicrobiales bacterium]